MLLCYDFSLYFDFGIFALKSVHLKLACSFPDGRIRPLKKKTQHRFFFQIEIRIPEVRHVTSPKHV